MLKNYFINKQNLHSKLLFIFKIIKKMKHTQKNPQMKKEVRNSISSNNNMNNYPTIMKIIDPDTSRK